MREAAIQIEQVSKSFQERKVLKNISCELNWGQVYGIVGNNGSGKTVLMKCICGLLPYDEGSIRVNGKKIGKDVDFPEDMGMIIESPGFLPGNDRNKESEDPGGSKSQNSGVADQGNHACCRA